MITTLASSFQRSGGHEKSSLAHEATKIVCVYGLLLRGTSKKEKKNDPLSTMALADYEMQQAEQCLLLPDQESMSDEDERAALSSRKLRPAWKKLTWPKFEFQKNHENSFSQAFRGGLSCLLLLLLGLALGFTIGSVSQRAHTSMMPALPSVAKFGLAPKFDLGMILSMVADLLRQCPCSGSQALSNMMRDLRYCLRPMMDPN